MSFQPLKNVRINCASKCAIDSTCWFDQLKRWAAYKAYVDLHKTSSNFESLSNYINCCSFNLPQILCEKQSTPLETICVYPKIFYKQSMQFQITRYGESWTMLYADCDVIPKFTIRILKAVGGKESALQTLTQISDVINVVFKGQLRNIEFSLSFPKSSNDSFLCELEVSDGAGSDITDVAIFVQMELCYVVMGSKIDVHYLYTEFFRMCTCVCSCSCGNFFQFHECDCYVCDSYDSGFITILNFVRMFNDIATCCTDRLEIIMEQCASVKPAETLSMFLLNTTNCKFTMQGTSRQSWQTCIEQINDLEVSAEYTKGNFVLRMNGLEVEQCLAIEKRLEWQQMVHDFHSFIAFCVNIVARWDIWKSKYLGDIACLFIEQEILKQMGYLFRKKVKWSLRLPQSPSEFLIKPPYKLLSLCGKYEIESLPLHRATVHKLLTNSLFEPFSCIESPTFISAKSLFMVAVSSFARMQILMDVERIELEKKRRIDDAGNKQSRVCVVCSKLTAKVYLRICGHAPWCLRCFQAYLDSRTYDYYTSLDHEYPTIKCPICYSSQLNKIIIMTFVPKFYVSCMTSIMCSRDECHYEPRYIDTETHVLTSCDTCLALASPEKEYFEIK